jgi:hypothetical protein
VLVIKKKTEDERYHTKLANGYIERLFGMVPKDKKLDASNSNEIIKLKNETLGKFLRNPDSKYNSTSILEKIKDSWLEEEEIFLYGKLNQHKQALIKLVNDKKLEEAEKYCREQSNEKSEALFTELFKLYISLFK